RKPGADRAAPTPAERSPEFQTPSPWPPASSVARRCTPRPYGPSDPRHAPEGSDSRRVRRALGFASTYSGAANGKRPFVGAQPLVQLAEAPLFGGRDSGRRVSGIGHVYEDRQGARSAVIYKTSRDVRSTRGCRIAQRGA